MVNKNDFNAKQFLKGFDEEMQNLMEIDKFYTNDGRTECAKIIVRGKEFEVKYWNTFAYFYGERPRGYKNYILSYEVTETSTKDGSMCIGFSKETFEDKKIDVRLMEQYFHELRKPIGASYGKKYTICSFKEFVNLLSNKLLCDFKSKGIKFIADFTVVDGKYDLEKLTNDVWDKIIDESYSWYGIKQIGDTGFDTYENQYLLDYYGGGYPWFLHIVPGEELTEDIKAKLKPALNSLLDCYDDDQQILAQWVEDKDQRRYRL